MSFIKNFIADESGASAAEYALIIAIVGVGIGAAALVLGNNVSAAVAEAANEVDECNRASGISTNPVGVSGSITYAGEDCSEVGAS